MAGSAHTWTEEQLEVFRIAGRKGGRPSHKDKRKPEAIVKATITSWAAWRSIPDEDAQVYIERVWTRKLPKVYERLIAKSEAGEEIAPLTIELLKAMTLMTSLSPDRQRARQFKEDSDDNLPAVTGLDLSELNPEQLAMLAGRPPEKPKRLGPNTPEAKALAAIKAIGKGRRKKPKPPAETHGQNPDSPEKAQSIQPLTPDHLNDNQTVPLGKAP